ncbi:MAG: choice-of-anchor A family protein [Eubacterium sp.]|nr:choice-of-anchor A family protein [Eubacterium sp.]
MNIREWRRWIALLMILILVSSGFTWPKHVSAYDTSQPAGQADLLEAVMEAGPSVMTEEADSRQFTEDDTAVQSPEQELLSEPEDEAQINQEAEQATDQTSSDSDNTIYEANDREIAEEAAKPELSSETETDSGQTQSGQVESSQQPEDDEPPVEAPLDMAYSGGSLKLMAAPARAAAVSTAVLGEDCYDIKHIIQSGYQMVCFGNAQINLHTMGSVLVAGDLTEGQGANGIADSPFSVTPSYVAGYVNGRQGFNNRQKQNPVQVLYVGSSNRISDDGKYLNGVGSDEGYNHGGTIEYNDHYVDWTRLKSVMVSTSSLMASSSTKTYSGLSDWQEIKDITAGSSVTLSNLGTHKTKLEIQGSNNNFTVITITDSGTVYVPQVIKYNGQTLSTNEDNEDMPVIFNFPNASEVIIPADLTPSFGHILAPNANVTVEAGNFNGIIICNNLVTNGEGHLRNYHGDLPKPKTFDIYVDKVDQSGHALAGAKLAIYDAGGEMVEEFTSSGKKHTVTLLAGTYTLKELEAPRGYKVAAEIVFTVDEEGNVTVDGTSVSEAAITMVDVYEPYVTIRKVDPEGNLLTGAVLEIREASGRLVGQFTTEGSEVSFKLDPGSYTLTEAEVPAGYQKAEDIAFSIDKDGILTIGDKITENVVIEMVDRLKPQVKVNKVDPEGNPLSGAKLAVTSTDGTVLGQFTTDGSVQTLAINPGDYILKELEAPHGYEIAEDIAFTVAADGKVTVGGTVVEDVTLVMVDACTPAETELNAEKTLRKGTLTGQDFRFTLTGLSGKGTGITKIWHAGYYQEESKDGYYEDVVIPAYKEYVWHPGHYETVQVDGYFETATWFEGWRRGLSFRPDWEWVTTGYYYGYVDGYYRHWVAAHTEKVWVNGYTEEVWHEAATEQVWREGGTANVWHEGYWEEVSETADLQVPMPAGSENNTCTVTNGEDGRISFGKISFATEGIFTYQITEESGSCKDSSESILYDTHTYLAKVTVTRQNGELKAAVEYTDGQGNALSQVAGNVSAEGTPLFVNTRMPELIIKKVNALDGNMTPDLYSQVRFALWSRSENGTETRIPGNAEDGNWMPAGDGTLSLGKSQPGIYIIREVQAPDGYMKLSEDVVITVSAAGEISLSSNPGNYVRLLGKGDEDCPDIATLNDEDKVLMVRNYPYIDMPEAGRNSRWMCFLFGPVLVMTGMGMLFMGKGSGRKERTAGGDFLS